MNTYVPFMGMKTPYSGLENIFLLASFADARYMRLLGIPTTMMLDGNRAKKEKDPVYICAIQYDNIQTDNFLQKHFSIGINEHMEEEIEELHLKKCLNSGVEYCICTPDRVIGTGKPI